MTPKRHFEMNWPLTSQKTTMTSMSSLGNVHKWCLSDFRGESKITKNDSKNWTLEGKNRTLGWGGGGQKWPWKIGHHLWMSSLSSFLSYRIFFSVTPGPSLLCQSFHPCCRNPGSNLLRTYKGVKLLSMYFRGFRWFLDIKVSRYCEGYSFL